MNVAHIELTLSVANQFKDDKGNQSKLWEAFKFNNSPVEEGTNEGDSPNEETKKKEKKKEKKKDTEIDN